MRRALAGGGQARIIAAEQLRQNVVARAPGLRHLNQRSADQVRDNHHLQQVRLFDQRQAIFLAQRYDRVRNALNKGIPGQDHQPGNATGVAFVHQAQQVGLVPGMVDAGDEYQFAAHDPLRQAFVLGHVGPAHIALQVAGTGAQGHFFQAGQPQNLFNREAQMSSCTTGSTARRRLISSSRM